MKQVPDVAKVDDAEQMSRLFLELASKRDTFNACRGKFGATIGETFASWISERDSVNSVLAEWGALIPATRVMLSVLSKLQRDGHTHAYGELGKALSNPGYLFPGETVPLHETRPVTVLMLDPVKTWCMIYNAAGDHPEWNSRGFSNEFPMFPALKRKYMRRKHPELERAYREAYHEAVTSRFQTYIPTGATRLYLQSDQYRGGVCMEMPFLYQFDGMEQSEVMGLFPREIQSQIYCWKFNVPRIIGNFKIGLHDDRYQTNGEWSKEHPSLVSVNRNTDATDYHGLILPAGEHMNRFYYRQRWERVSFGVRIDVSRYLDHGAGIVFTSHQVADLEQELSR